MMRFNGLILAVALFCAAAAHGVTVSGYALLSGGDSDAGTKILFTASSPSAATDSTYTDSDGHFSISLAPGVYDVTYSHEGYASYPLPDQALLFDTELEQVLLLPPISGSLSGTIGPGLFQVVDTIRIGQRAYLNILPGTHFFFDGPHPFIVEGLLEAIGTEQDSIVFTRRYPTEESRWGGIRFENNPSGDSCRMEYCVVEWAVKLYYPQHHGNYGGGICVQGSSPRFSNCTIRWNHAPQDATGGGAGIYIAGGNPDFVGCLITENSSNYIQGAGIYCWGSSSLPRFESCRISANICASFSGGGMFLTEHCQTTLINCDIVDNVAGNTGGGICLTDQACVVAEGCRLENNRSGNGGGIYGTGSQITAESCVFSGNRAYLGAAILMHYTGGAITNCTIINNRMTDETSMALLFSGSEITLSSSIVFGSGPGISLYFEDSPSAIVQYINSSGYENGNIGFVDNDPSNGPPAIGIVALTNANGDSCDTYYNIFLDPLLADTAAGDYHLTEGSPCIDAGDPSLPYDPDGTVADIGAFYYDQTEAVRDFERNALRPYRLIGNYPNPFNAATRIGFELERAGDVRLFVYDITGRLVRTLMNASLSGGSHEVVFDAGNLPSGIYLYSLEAGGRIVTKKMVLLK